MIKIVFFGRSHFQYNGFDSMKLLLNDVINDKNFYYVGTEKNCSFSWMNYFYLNRVGSSIKKRIGVPFKSSAFRNYMQYHEELHKDDIICFIFVRYEPWFFGENGFLEFLKQEFPNSKTVYLLLNVNRYLQIDFETFRLCFDKVITIDKGDAEEYGLDYFPFFYSAIETFDPTLEESDCFYVGNAKKRLDEILTVFKLLSTNGLKCDFHIVGVPEEQQRYQDQIIYNQPMNYDDVVCHVKKTKMLLEIMQEGQTCGTLREHEAVIYGKKLLTNNKGIVDQVFYSPQNISVFSDPKMIDLDFTKNLNDSVKYNDNDKESISPRVFVKYIEELFRD